MGRSMKIVGLTAGLVLCLSGMAEAQTAHRHTARAQGAAGRQIVVHPRESWLTAGTNALPGEFNSYALFTISPMNRMPDIEHTFSGERGLDRLPNNFTVPGCCGP